MSDTVWPPLQLGAEYSFMLVGGLSVQGTVQEIQGAWLYLRQDSALLALPREQVQVIAVEGNLPSAGSSRKRGSVAASSTSGDSGFARTSAEIPDDDTLRRVVSAILDGVEGAELRAVSGLSASLLARVRQAFECARGNLQAEDIPPAARVLVDHIRHALGG